jgi:serine/threonine-protein kinase
VRINDLFEINDKKLISMEYIDGRDLKRILMEQKRLDKATLRSYVMQIGEGLEYAHKRGVIHRDIKPANIMITSDTHEVKITDFGIAKNLQSDDMTTGSRILGTPLYMAPEQIEGKAVDARSDIYALGIMMYEMVTGTPPFCEGNIEYQHIHMDPPPMPANVDSGVASIILKAVQKKKEDRFRNVRDLMDALAGI